jgi:predicted enzyme related to lactoylglutathione lyase
VSISAGTFVVGAEHQRTTNERRPEMANTVGWFEVVGKDGPALQRFYGDVFGWGIDASNPMGYGMTSPAQTGIGGGIGPTADGSGGHATFYVEVDSPKATLERIEAAGGRTIVPETEIPNMVTFALFADPEGHVVGLYKGNGAG